ncbi:MAG: Mth938-like domain-containing protein [Nanobdellota archaeon]
MIDHYAFGEIKIDGKSYKKDLIIFPDRVMAGWRRDRGHHLKKPDLEEVFNYKPKKLIIGTGKFGVMKVDESVREKARELNIELIEEKTDKACELFNEEEDAVAALHLTC